jgi:hypothetical protein
MFYEYALEPELVAQWCDRAGFAAFMQRFGVDARRIVSRFPKRWERGVDDAFLRKYPTPSLMQNQRKTQIISHLMKRTVRRGSVNFETDIPWLENAEKEHGERPFNGIIAGANPREHTAVAVVCSADDILERFDQSFPSSREVERSAAEMAAAISPLLRCCDYAVFVDPHFDAKRRFLDPFRLFMEELVIKRVTTTTPRTELHIAVENMLDPALELRRANERIASLQRALSSILPSGHSLRIIVWRERLMGQKLHNRYLLTDIGSVSFGIGLDCNEDSFNPSYSHVQTDDIHCLSEDHQDRRWCEYISTPAFDKVVEISITGS